MFREILFLVIALVLFVLHGIPNLRSFFRLLYPGQFDVDINAAEIDPADYSEATVRAMTDTGQTLFQAMCERPWDTSLRLQYAAWLQQNGQAQWAAFVRCQCQNPDYSLSRFQANYLFDLFDEVGEFDPYESDWLKKLPQLPGVSWWGSGFKGGFVHDVAFCPATAFPKHAATVFASTPIDTISLERLTVASLRDVLTSSFLSRLECLSLCGDYGDEGMRLLAACPHLTRLKWLFIMENGCGDDGAEALASSPYLGNLQNLYFPYHDHQIGDRGALALAQSPNLSSVTFLSFNETDKLSQPVVDALKKRFQYLDGWPTRD